MPSNEPIVFLGGRMIPASQAHIKIYDLAVVLGATITDLVRTFGHRPFRLDDHVARFYRSSKYARIQPLCTPQETSDAILELIEHNASLIGAEHDLAVVMFLSPGENMGYAGAAAPAGGMTPTFCIHSFPLRFQDWREIVENGVHVVTPSIRHVPPQCLDPKIKNRSRLHFWIAQEESHLVDPEAIPLLLDVDGNITETSGSNFIMVSDGTVRSPSPRNILRGISLVTAMELCEQLDIDFSPGDFQVYDVMNADEAMLPTTPYCLGPVTRINGTQIGDGRPGPVHARLMAAWSELVGMDILKQIRTVEYP